jgi:hypothetical protein
MTLYWSQIKLPKCGGCTQSEKERIRQTPIYDLPAATPPGFRPRAKGWLPMFVDHPHYSLLPSLPPSVDQGKVSRKRKRKRKRPSPKRASAQPSQLRCSITLRAMDRTFTEAGSAKSYVTRVSADLRQACSMTCQQVRQLSSFVSPLPCLPLC